MSQPLISARDLHKSFGEIHAVDGVSLQVAPGEIYGLVGPDGAGKTTLLRLLCGALHSDSGEATLGEHSIITRTEEARRLIGYLAQRFSLYEDLTVIENLQFFAEVRGMSSAEWAPRSQEILEFVGLDEFKTRRAGQLSGGARIHGDDQLAVARRHLQVDGGGRARRGERRDGCRARRRQAPRGVLLGAGVHGELPRQLGGERVEGGRRGNRQP